MFKSPRAGALLLYHVRTAFFALSIASSGKSWRVWAMLSPARSSGLTHSDMTFGLGTAIKTGTRDMCRQQMLMFATQRYVHEFEL